MTAAFLFSIPALLLIATATPRQADQVLGQWSTRQWRTKLRILGLSLLLLSFSAALADPDRTRAIITWAGAIAIQTVLLALLFTVMGPSRTASQGPR